MSNTSQSFVHSVRGVLTQNKYQFIFYNLKERLDRVKNDMMYRVIRAAQTFYKNAYCA